MGLNEITHYPIKLNVSVCCNTVALDLLNYMLLFLIALLQYRFAMKRRWEE